MKKWICIILTCFLLISVPVRGYAVSPVVWGIGEEVILPFLLALLGVQATETISSYDDLKAYNLTIKDSLVDSLSGLAGMETIQAWIMKAVSGMIETDSIVWQKLRDLAISNYLVSSGSVTVNNANQYFSGIKNFVFYSVTTASVHASYGNWTVYGSKLLPYGYPDGAYWTQISFLMCDSIQNSTLTSSYTYNNKTVYYRVFGANDRTENISTSIEYINNREVAGQFTNSGYAGQYAWTAVYGDFVVPNDNIASYSDAFDDVLTSSEKDDIIDGTCVVQLYNPDALQNGLEIMPGGDPEDDPNLKKIPFAVTADWWNFLQQFGQGSSSNQYVNAYNALNGLDGTSIGRISDAYDSLGIANIVGSAANAAEGIVNLTDNNIYPNAQTVADSVNGTIPQILDPESPDSGIDNESPNGLYKLPDLRDYFPFCIPFDLIHLLSILAADPVTPEFVIKLSDGNHEASTIASLEVLESVSQIVRNFELAGFCLGLILITRGIIRG